MYSHMYHVSSSYNSIVNNKHSSWYKEINNNVIIASRAYFLQEAAAGMEATVVTVVAVAMEEKEAWQGIREIIVYP